MELGGNGGRLILAMVEIKEEIGIIEKDILDLGVLPEDIDIFKLGNGG